MPSKGKSRTPSSSPTPGRLSHPYSLVFLHDRRPDTSQGDMDNAKRPGTAPALRPGRSRRTPQRVTRSARKQRDDTSDDADSQTPSASSKLTIAAAAVSGTGETPKPILTTSAARAPTDTAVTKPTSSNAQYLSDTAALAATSRALIDSLGNNSHLDRPRVNLANNPINLKVLMGDEPPTSAVSGKTLGSDSRGNAAPEGTVSQVERQPSSEMVYSDEEEPESAGSGHDDSSSSSDGAFNCRRAIRHHDANRHDPRGGSVSSDDSDEDEWGPVTNGLNINLDSTESDDEDGMFIPEPVIRLDNARQKPALPYHTKEDLLVGKRVWVVDEEDVETLLNGHFNRTYEMVCNGKMPGIVMRHNGDMTMVTFDDPDSQVQCSLTMPRACLSLEPIEPYESNYNRASNRVFGSYYCNVGPKTNGGRSAAEKRKGNLFQQFYECVPALRVPKDSLGDLAEAQTLFQVGSLAEALDIVNRKLVKAEEELAASLRTVAAASQKTTPARDTHRTGDSPPSTAALSGSLSFRPTASGAALDDIGTGVRSPTTFVVDILVLRSRIYVFLEQFQDALEDARRCAQLEPEWVRAHLSLARAHSALGNWEEATAALRTAVALLPASTEVQRIYQLTTYLVGIQQRLDEGGHDVRLTLDHLYRKRLYTKHNPHIPGDILCAEEIPILAVSSLFSDHPCGRCSVCFRDGAEEMEMVTSTRTNPATGSGPSEGGGHHDRTGSMAAVDGVDTCPDDAAGGPLETVHGGGGGGAPSHAYFCSRGCQQRASLYTQMEAKHWTSLEKARGIIRARAATVDDRWPLEMASMTLRLFYMVVSTHRRLTTQYTHTQTAAVAAEHAEFLDSSKPIDLNEEVVLPCVPQPQPLSLDIALKHLGLFPLASDTLTPFSREALATIHETLVAEFREESKKLYGKELLFYLYTYVKTYFTPVQLTPKGEEEEAAQQAAASTPEFAFFLPWLVGCTDRRDPPSEGSTLTRSDSSTRKASASATGIPDRIGGSAGLTVQALLAAEDAALGGKAEGADGPEANCRISICSTHSKTKAVVQCPEDGEALCDPERDRHLSMPEGPLLEMEVIRPVNPHAPLRIHVFPPL